MSETETIHFNEKEYKALEAAAKVLDFKSVDEMVNTAVEYFIKTKLIQTEEVKVKIPKKLLAVFKDHEGENLSQYLNDSITDSLAADLYAGVFGDMDDLLQKYDLKEEFRFYQGH